MHALIVVAHPNANSLTHSLATHVAEGIESFDPANSFEIADLSAESFDPRFTSADLSAYFKEIPFPADVAAEQARIDRANALVLVYPVYWWSMPGILKGWIDRVFTNGWAYEEGPDGKVTKKLQHMQIHLIALGGADIRTYARHGYFGAMKTQIDHGIFDYCGPKVITSELLIQSETQDPTAHLRNAHTIGRNIFAPPKQSKTADAA
ncbi:NAD(P)H-dependent oxidoreductase [Thalassospira sp.]|uniref:NAD(P)H-dependent oxidoreductase n=1 Tax=Thalassospira sp. TaxID=1912094 RepID=UPI0027354CCF|nr:NAD(P)H-dependent oxidoreductase [Thalassospira sp.]MDP2696753.1 NAD(P)H-dependent oxidoreductase [Thalassospira sp.]